MMPLGPIISLAKIRLENSSDSFPKPASLHDSKSEHCNKRLMRSDCPSCKKLDNETSTGAASTTGRCRGIRSLTKA